MKTMQPSTKSRKVLLLILIIIIFIFSFFFFYPKQKPNMMNKRTNDSDYVGVRANTFPGYICDCYGFPKIDIYKGKEICYGIYRCRLGV